jgi:hypothetical protein
MYADADTPPDPNGVAVVPTYRTPAPFPASTPEPPPRLQRWRRLRCTPLAHFDVYMDDCLGKGSTTTLKAAVFLLRLSAAVAGVQRYAATAIVVGLDVKAAWAFPDKNIRTECAAIF